jgi:hypothetical protein
LPEREGDIQALYTMLRSEGFVSGPSGANRAAGKLHCFGPACAHSCARIICTRYILLEQPPIPSPPSKTGSSKNHCMTVCHPHLTLRILRQSLSLISSRSSFSLIPTGISPRLFGAGWARTSQTAWVASSSDSSESARIILRNFSISRQISPIRHPLVLHTTWRTYAPGEPRGSWLPA